MNPAEIRKLTELEHRHWWYAERRRILGRLVQDVPAGARAIDVGAAGGGNTQVLVDRGLRACAIEYGPDGADVARSRGLSVIRGDAQALPIANASVGLVVAFDVLEHLADDRRATHEIARVLTPGGRVVVAVPADPGLWSAHDEAVGHVRRYTRESLQDVIDDAGLTLVDMWSWNVLLRPVVRLRRARAVGSDLDDISGVTNAALRAVVAAERLLPVRRLPGVSLMATARRPS